MINGKEGKKVKVKVKCTFVQALRLCTSPVWPIGGVEV